jgi:hypothetical protein
MTGSLSFAAAPNRLRRWSLPLILVLVLLALGSPAEAHNSRGWYWSETKAERVLDRTFWSLRSPWCTGFGPWRYRGQAAVYSHFYCSFTVRGSRRSATLLVTGRRSGKLVSGHTVIPF